MKKNKLSGTLKGNYLGFTNSIPTITNFSNTNQEDSIKEKQQTAVDWYDNQLRKVFSNTTEASNFSHEELLQQAREMEKQRAIKFACDVHMNVKKDKVKSLMQLVDEKYNETYGGKK
jgi:hypothetical protein